MKTHHFPFVALFLALPLLVAVIFGQSTAETGATVLPLLTLLIISEFAFFVTAIGTYTGIKYWRADFSNLRYKIAGIVCGLLAIRFMAFGIALWPF